MGKNLDAMAEDAAEFQDRVFKAIDEMDIEELTQRTDNSRDILWGSKEKSIFDLYLEQNYLRSKEVENYLEDQGKENVGYSIE